MEQETQNENGIEALNKALVNRSKSRFRRYTVNQGKLKVTCNKCGEAVIIETAHWNSFWQSVDYWKRSHSRKCK